MLLLGALVLLPLPVRRWKIAGKHAPAVVQDWLRHHAYRRRGMQPWALLAGVGPGLPRKPVGGAGRRADTCRVTGDPPGAPGEPGLSVAGARALLRRAGVRTNHVRVSLVKRCNH